MQYALNAFDVLSLIKTSMVLVIIINCAICNLLGNKAPKLKIKESQVYNPKIFMLVFNGFGQDIV